MVHLWALVPPGHLRRPAPADRAGESRTKLMNRCWRSAWAMQQKRVFIHYWFTQCFVFSVHEALKTHNYSQCYPFKIWVSHQVSYNLCVRNKSMFTNFLNTEWYISSLRCWIISIPSFEMLRHRSRIWTHTSKGEGNQNTELLLSYWTLTTKMLKHTFICQYIIIYNWMISNA